MASRTKDSDSSIIKLTKFNQQQKIENELQRKPLVDIVERMKTHIELEEKEKMLPGNGKWKSKNYEGGEFNDGLLFDEDLLRDEYRNSRHSSNLKQKDKLSICKSSKPPPTTMNYSELLKIAEKKQYEPIMIPKKIKEDEKLMTIKQHRTDELEQYRIRRKIERDRERAKSKSSNRLKHSSSSKPSFPIGKATGRPPPLEKNGTPCSAQSFKIPQGGSSASKSAFVPKTLEKSTKVPNSRPSKEQLKTSKTFTNHDRIKPSKSSEHSDKCRVKPRPKENLSVLSNKRPAINAKPFRSKGDGETAQTVAAAAPVPNMTVDTDAIASAKHNSNSKQKNKNSIRKASGPPPPMSYSELLKVAEEKQHELTMIHEKLKEEEKLMTQKQCQIEKLDQDGIRRKLERSRERAESKPSSKQNMHKKFRPPPAVKKPFHPNPYLDPPRIRLDPKSLKPRNLIFRFENDSDEDDMSDFIDDGPSQNDEDFLKYIQENISKKTRYVDEDDDDIIETNYGELLKEETHSARLGYLEDLEEEKKKRAMKKKHKKKLKK